MKNMDWFERNSELWEIQDLMPLGRLEVKR